MTSTSTTAMPPVLAATWRDGLFVVTGKSPHHELAGHSVSGPVSDGRGGVLAIVNRRSLRRRAADGTWGTIVTSESDLSCCVTVGDSIFVGTDDARVLRVSPNGMLEQLAGFEDVEGRSNWYAGAALIDGRLVGPPLGVRSIAATCNDAVLLVNVHVGGIPRSTDGGITWQPTIDIDSDVHQVCAHPTRPDIVIAASGIGLCVSGDSGATWSAEDAGLHAPYCSAVAIAGDSLFVAASADHFAEKGAIYRRPVNGSAQLLPVGGGLPRWTEGIVDTGCIAARASRVAVVDKAGNLYASEDAGRTWSRVAGCPPAPSGLFIC